MDLSLKMNLARILQVTIILSIVFAALALGPASAIYPTTGFAASSNLDVPMD